VNAWMIKNDTMPTFNCSAILFDLDGVLVDSTRSVSRQYRLWAQKANLDPRIVENIPHGVRAIDVVRQLAPHLGAEAEVERLEKMEAEDQEGVVVMPGATELLESIPGNRWCVVTSGTRYLATCRLKHANLPIPRVMVSADDVSKGKPDPEPYLTGARLLGMNSSDCLVIEDAPAGIQAAHAGKMKVIAITSTYPASALEADVVVQRLAQIKVSGQGSLSLTVNVE
jgi:mannitol-1-/sugar-/sorbitol-6-phosphatase